MTNLKAAPKRSRWPLWPLALPALLLSLAASPMAVRLAVIPGTLALYQFDEGRGTIAGDETEAHPAWLSPSAPLWTGGQDGPALDFRVADSQLTVAPAIPVGPAWTVQAWAHFPVTQNATFWNYLVAGFYEVHVLTYKNELGTFTVLDGWVGSGFDVDSLEGWHLVTVVANEGTEFFIDGTSVGAVTPQVSSPIERLGGGSGCSWGGTIDSVRILDVARTAPEIALDAMLTPPGPPRPPEGAVQKAPDGSVIAPGGGTHGAFGVEATVNSTTGQDLLLEVEVKALGIPFDGATGISRGETVATGEVASVAIAALPLGAYRWQARVVEPSTWFVSPWVSYGSDPDNLVEIDIEVVNSAPAPVGEALQHAGDSGAPVAAGRSVDDSSGLRIDVTAVDPDLDGYRLQVEVAPLGLPFRGQPTMESDLVASGQTASLMLVLPVGRYCWQSRVVDPAGSASAWQPFGSGTGADFQVGWAGSRNSAGGCSSAPAPRTLVLLLLGVLLPALRR